MLDIIQLTKASRLYHIFPILIIIFGQILFINTYTSNHLVWSLNWDSGLKNYIFMLANILYTNYSIPFILISILLLIAMVGAIVLTLETSFLTRRQYLTYQHQRNNSWT